MTVNGAPTEQGVKRTSNAYSALCTGHGRLLVSSYLSENEREELEVSVRVISRMALFTSMIAVAVSSRNMSTTMTKIHIDARERRAGLLCRCRKCLCAALV